ncbi:MAG: sigma factor-like helix-turn-helix DNA-binding protein [Clostridia bacterium]
MEKQDKLFVSLFNDYYGALLTDNQQDVVQMYYDEDMSLSEIGTQLGISPQGVRDRLQRAEKTLVELENKLHLVEKTSSMRKLLEELYPLASEEKKQEIDDILHLLEK